MKVKRSPARRGVLLLVVLGMLAMFAMMAVAFVVLTGHERRGAEAARKVDQVVDPPEQQLDQALGVVVRGSNNPASAIKSRSLLEKIYGQETITLPAGANITFKDGSQLPAGATVPVRGRVASVIATPRRSLPSSPSTSSFTTPGCRILRPTLLPSPRRPIRRLSQVWRRPTSVRS